MASRTAEIAILDKDSPLASIKFTPEQLEQHIKTCINALEILVGSKKPGTPSAILMPGDPGFRSN